MSVTALIARLRDERGFTMVTVLGVLLVSSAFALAAFAASNNDIAPVQQDIDGKRAYAAAEAGLNWYEWQITHNNAFWTNCDKVPGGVQTPQSQWPVNQPGANPRVWETLPGTTAQWSLDLMPQNGASACDGTAATMIDATTGTIQIRSTGVANAARRSLIGTFKHQGFLNFLYYTKYEDEDPAAYGGPSSCAAPRSQRSGCNEIEFIGGDSVNGPMHTEDSFMICGSPTFGRNQNDKIEIVGSPPIVQNCGGSQPNWQGKEVNPATSMPMPQTNSSLISVAKQGGWYFKGITQLSVTGASITARSASGTTLTQDATGRTLGAWPGNGVVYVDANGSAACNYTVNQQYNNPSNCGDVYVKGDYSSSLTVASANDVVFNGPFTRDTGNNAVAGVIPQNFARIYHPVGGCSNSSSGPYGPSLGTNGVEIDSAILALQHSFIVDNFSCGQALGTLTVNGAIAQQFRGPVGQSGGYGGNTGYIKDYIYDDRFQNVNPPYFLDPVQAAWRLGRFTEQIPAS